MTGADFYFDQDILVGFEVKGHSTASAEDDTGRLVCAAVSSAAFMTANTLTEIIGAKADITVDEGEMKLMVKSDLESCQDVLSGFLLHMQQLSEQYKNYVTINLEV